MRSKNNNFSCNGKREYRDAALSFFYKGLNMRHSKTIATTLIIPMLMVACKTEEKKVETVAYRYLDAIGNYRFAEARAYATQQTCDVTLDFYQNVVIPHTPPQALESNLPAKITIKEVSVVDDTTAWATFHNKAPKTEHDDTVRLVKEDGEWKVRDVIIIPEWMKNMINGEKHDTKALQQAAKEGKLKRVEGDRKQ